ncbi:MAG: leucine-rich repeat protein [Alistipes sp.]|nr:leucine-rich repeat protein [Alistipes sp.]
MMKRLFLLLAAAALLSACSSAKEVDEPTEPPTPEAAKRLETLCEQLNSDLATLYTLIAADELPDCVVSVAPIAPAGEIIGYGLAFKQNGAVTLYLDPDAKTQELVPQFGVYEADGIRCWAMNGQPLLTATGAPVPVVNDEGTVPRLKAEKGYWHISVDDGKSWWPAGLAPDGTTELVTMPLVSQITEEPDAWSIVLADGETAFSIPKEGTLHIEVDAEETLTFQPNEIHTVHYTVTGGSNKTVVTAKQENSETGIYKFKVTPTADILKGSVAITADVPATNKVLITATDGSRTATTSVDVTLRFESSATLITILTPGTLAELLTDYDQEAITELTIVGNPNDKDIRTLKGLPNLAVLDLESAQLEILPAYAFEKKTSLTSVKLPKVLKEIGRYAFQGCSGLTSITFPDGITTFESCAFDRCQKLDLRDITLPESVTTIGYAAFYDCRFGTKITIPQNVTSIGQYAFWAQRYGNQPRLSSIYCKAVVPPSTGGTVFLLREGVQKPFLRVPVGSGEAYKTAEYWKTFSYQTLEEEF